MLHLQRKVRESTYGHILCTDTLTASDPAQNPYWKRDVRRAYPQLSVVTQAELSGLLIEHHEAQQAYVLVPYLCHM